MGQRIMGRRVAAAAACTAAALAALMTSGPLPASPSRLEEGRGEVRRGAEAVLLITDASALRAIEAAGGSLSARLGEAPDLNNDALARTPWLGVVAAALEADLAEVRAADPASDVGLSKPHRLFDARWLRSPRTRLELVGVANRIDRLSFERAACGEVRFIYRLAYATEVNGVPAASRLPMTISVVTWAKDARGGADCRAVAARWMAPAGLSGEALGRWAMTPAGPLAPALLARERLKSVEVNLQSVRWPSTIRPDMAGHAEYLLRVFKPDAAGKRLVASPLENTPDVERLRKNAALRADLVAWVRQPENLARIDAGTAVMPDRFLATRVTSVSPRGLSRRANRPFRQLIEAGALPTAGFEGRRFVRSAAGLLRRLDGMSCQGCHQSRSVAGFHLIGADSVEHARANAIAVAGSPHLMSDIPRRARFVRALAAGQLPDDARPLSERSDDGEGGHGSHCRLGAADPSFATWDCAAGLACAEADDPEPDGVGHCLPATGTVVGDPCQMGRVKPSADPHRDRVIGPVTRDCGGGAVCQTNRAGFPGGMCSVPCDALPADGVCGGIPILRSFNDCLAKKKPFELCIAENARPNGLRACDDAHPCRDDYICARIGREGGGCMPPYFLFQLRVDGHPRVD